MADRYEVVTIKFTGQTGAITLYDNKAEGGPQSVATFYTAEAAERVAALLNDDWEAEQPTDTPERQRALVYKQLTSRHRIALLAIKDGAKGMGNLGIEYPRSAVEKLVNLDLVEANEVGAVLPLRLTEFGARVAEGVAKRQPKKGYTA